MLRVLAPAKCNLFLRVLGKRPDGYHELETLFERLDLADEIAFAPQSSGISLTCDDPTLECGPSNLVTRAADLLQQSCGVSQGAAIRLTKRIPIAAGLGGGSSDAAATLLGLNQLWALGLSAEPLWQLAAQLGADVPFFLEPTPFAIGRGRGDACEPIRSACPTLWQVLVTPPARLSTKDIYDGFDGVTTGRGLTGEATSVTMLIHALRNGSLRELAEGWHNDLQPEAIRRCPVIHEILTSLQACGCLGSVVSGSGPSVVGLCEDRRHADTAARRLRTRSNSSWRIAVVKTFSSND